MNGWKNYQTWNAALYLQNEEPLYRLAREYKRLGYSALVRILARQGVTHTGDGVAYADKRVSRKELNEMLREL